MVRKVSTATSWAKLPSDFWTNPHSTSERARELRVNKVVIPSTTNLPKLQSEMFEKLSQFHFFELGKIEGGGVFEN